LVHKISRLSFIFPPSLCKLSFLWHNNNNISLKKKKKKRKEKREKRKEKEEKEKEKKEENKLFFSHLAVLALNGTRSFATYFQQAFLEERLSEALQTPFFPSKE